MKSRLLYLLGAFMVVFIVAAFFRAALGVNSNVQISQVLVAVEGLHADFDLDFTSLDSAFASVFSVSQNISQFVLELLSIFFVF